MNISKQAVFQARKRQINFDTELMELVTQADTLREEHPGCGVEKMYKTLKPQYVGRDKFCEIFMDLGYRIRTIKNYRRTTIPTHLNYPNLIEGMLLRNPRQVLQSDITYFDIDGTFHYLVFILDVYTREILGYNVSNNMRKASNIKALRMALKQINPGEAKEMIHHSDRGSQYGSTAYKEILRGAGIKLSMGLKAQDNAFAERINGTIKNEYLNLWHINNLRTLRAKTKKAVEHYNAKRQHDSLNGKTPKEFRSYVINLDAQERPMTIIYADGNYKVKEALNLRNLNPKEEPQAYNCPIEL